MTPPLTRSKYCSTGLFHKFDHGPLNNLKLYGSKKPPEYNLSNIQTKMHIIYGTNDYLVRQEVKLNIILLLGKADDRTFYAQFQNVPILMKKIRGSVVAVNPINSFNHLNFIVGRLVHKIPPIILRVIRKLTWWANQVNITFDLTSKRSTHFNTVHHHPQSPRKSFLCKTLINRMHNFHHFR